MDDGPDFPFVDDGLGGDAGGIEDDAEDLWAGTQGQELKKSRPENVHYAKKAKRVDVKRLKDEIWTGLRIRTAESDTGDESVSIYTRGTDCS
jgi:condensin complex subunit 2